MKRSLWLVFVLLLICGTVEAQVTVIKAGRLIDPDKGAVLTDQVIVIRENKIEAVGPGLTIPQNANVIDLSKMTVLPGLIDCHTHLADGKYGEGDPLFQLKKSASRSVLESVPNARAMLESGFTTVRDVGVYRALNDVALRDAINRGDIIGPRMYVAGAYITITGGAGAMTGMAPDIQLPWDFHYGEANSPWEVRQKVRLLVQNGADHIKVLSTGAVLTHGSNPKSEEFTPEELQAAVDEASHFGLRVAAHAHATEGIKNAIRAGVASVEHATLIDDEGIALAKQHGTYLVFDIYNDDYILQEGAKVGMLAESIEKEKKVGRLQRENFRHAWQSGVTKMAFGTDAGVYPHGDNAKQFAKMVEWGMKPIDAIQAATIKAADLIGQPDKIGAIEAGHYADIIAVAGDPTTDVRVLESVKFVMKGGTIVRNDFGAK